MFIDLAHLEIEHTVKGTGGSEFIRAFSRGHSATPYVIHRLPSDSHPAAGLAAIHQTRRLVEKYHFACMLRIVATIESTAAMTVVYEDVAFKHLASRKTATTKVLLEQAIQVVDALREVHAAGLILHRVEPTSFVLTDSGAKILDFGQASTQQVEYRELKNPSQIEGDLHYIAPEQTGRLNRGVDCRSDYYSLGVIFYEMFVGTVPFHAEDPLDLVYEHLAKTPISPHEFDSSIHPFISGIIEKLLSKDPGRRYQSAEGILADLTLALHHDPEVPLTSEKLGHLDVPYNLHISTRLYGRKDERAQLIDAYARACEGFREVVYLYGYSGIGKTSLIRETYIPITRQHSYFVSGKFEQLERRFPYSAWLGACANLLTTVLTEPGDKLAEIRQTVEVALGANAGVLMELLPQLAILMGPRPLPLPLPPREAQERFVQAFCNFIGAFCSPGRPLAIFLDDMQWADTASLNLLERVVTDQASRHVFVIVAARDNELTQTHPFTRALDGIESQAECSLTKVALAALGREELTQLVADTFCLPSAEAAQLSGILATKSGGNPFFAWQFLHLLRAKGLVQFSTELMRWTWNASAINALGHSDNVVELMLRRLHQLPAQTRRALSWAACLGAQFELVRLSRVMSAESGDMANANSSLVAVRASLEPALAEELIVPTGSPMLMDGLQVSSKFRFAHDRVQEAAYKLFGDDQIPAARRHIARLLLHGATEQQISENVFEIADHLNAASSLVVDHDERIELARINLRAARRAAESAAFDAALAYSTSASTIVPSDIWSAQPELARSLWCARGEFEYLNSNFGLAERFIREAIDHEADTHTKAELHQLLVVQYTLRAAYPEAIASARAGLALLSVHLPDENLVKLRDEELTRVRQLLGSRPLDSLANLPVMTDRTQRVVMKLLIAMGPPCYRSHPRLWSMIVAYEMRLCLEHGIAPGATYTFPAFGGLLQFLQQGSADDCRNLHQATRAIFPSVSGPMEVSVGHLMMGSSLDHWFAPLASSSRDYHAAYTIGVDSGNLQYAAYALAHDAYCKFFQGIPLRKLMTEIEGYRDFCTRRKNFWGMDLTEGVLRVVNTLSSDAESPDFSLGSTSEADYLQLCDEHRNIQVLGIYYTLAAEALLHMNRFDDAARAIVQASKRLACFAKQGLLPSTQYHFIRAILLLSTPECFGLSATDALSEARTIAERARKWATECPQNYLHISALLDTEIAVATNGDITSIMDGFDTALSSALEQNFHHRAGLVATRAAAFWKKRQKPHYAAIYESSARSAYQAWQAGSCVGVTQSDGNSSLTAERARPRAVEPTMPATRLQVSIGQQIDLRSIVRTSHAVAKSTELADVVKAVIDNVKKVSGAGRTVLLLPHHQGKLYAWEARYGAQWQSGGIPMDEIVDLPRSVVHYVTRTLNTVRVDGREESAFSRDAYIQATRPASIVCVPILLAQQMQGILYLESREIPGAFDESRLQIIEFLAASAAAAVRNANLVHQLRADIALRIETEAKWREGEREHRMLIEQSPLGIQVFSADGHQIQTNRAFVDMWGTQTIPESLHQHPLFFGIPNAMHLIEKGETLDLGDHSFEDASVPPSQQRWYKGRAYGVTPPSGTLERIVVMLEDITERKRIEELKSEFVSTVSHELRTPLTSIRGSLGLLMGGIAGELTTDTKELINIALANSERLARLVNDILDFDKIEHGKLALHMEHVRLADLLRSTIDSNRGFAQQHQITLGLTLPREAENVIVEVDRDRLAQIMTNLISNAAKFSSTHSQVVVAVIMQQSSVRIEVRDQGEGVPIAFRSRLFQRFSQADSSDTRRHSGTGIGLSITRELVEKMNGSIGYEPIEPQGSCFFVEFPNT